VCVCVCVDIATKFMRRIATDFFNLQLNLCTTFFCCICIPCSHKKWKKGFIRKMPADWTHNQ